MSTHSLPNTSQNQPALTTNTSVKTTRYDSLYKVLHWLVGSLILLMLIAKIGFANAITTEDKLNMLIGHSSIGSVLALLIIIRVVKRFVIKSERPIQTIPNWQKRLSGIVHLALYFCLIMIPLTGYLSASFHQLPVMPFTLINLSRVSSSGYVEADFLLMRSIHENMINLLIILLFVHIGGALYHKFIKKDDVMATMTPSKKIKKVE
ncbi:cytochrome b [Marinomonas sp. PE14-40]|uniref:cytochrome b n=1 Tax=Marinomonas sp. PE14-40 TaxID=3060621 RepID=UPI003F66D619